MLDLFLQIPQVCDYARRKKTPTREIEKWLNIQLAYERDDEDEVSVTSEGSF
jgi:hypothetical protein